jgi:twitching motility protein PilT
MAFDLDSALADTIRVGASDLHVKVPAVPRVRVAGKLIELPGAEPVGPDDTRMIQELVLNSEVKRTELARNGSTDLSYYNASGRFRVSAFTQRGVPSFVFRAVPTAPDSEKLGLPTAVTGWADALRGLVVITGPTGSGKSTTCAAILDLINRRRDAHILTIEDPIEFLHSDQRSIVCQREIGVDAPTYHVALRAALRQDPDVILIGEVRDEETAMTALRAAETGHLVLCTMHTIDAAETVQRLIDLFGENRGAVARQMLAATLVGVCSQRLVPGEGGGRALNAEVLVNSARVQGLITEDADLSELHKAIKEGDFYGMRTFDQCLIEKVHSGAVAEADALQYATNTHDFRLMLMQAGVDSERAKSMDAPHPAH